MTQSCVSTVGLGACMARSTHVVVHCAWACSSIYSVWQRKVSRGVLAGFWVGKMSGALEEIQQVTLSHVRSHVTDHWTPTSNLMSSLGQHGTWLSSRYTPCPCILILNI